MSYANQKQLRNHIYNIHEGHGKKHECEKCVEIFYTKRDLIHHTIDKHNNCEACGKIFEGPNAQRMLKSHIKNVHEGQRNQVCEVCGKNFQSKQDMTRHVDSVHLKKQIWKNIRKNYPEGKKPIVERSCEFCEENFTHYQLLKLHVSAKHSKLISFDCRKCNKTFPSKLGFYTHLKSNHENDCYQCKICQKPFKLTFEKEVKLKIINVKCYENLKCYLCEKQNSTSSQKYL